jgi:hypothetical protein
LTATGGITGSFTSGSYVYKYHKFNSNGTFTISGGATADLQILVVGGGGGGQGTISVAYTKGGGAGGVNYYYTTGSLVSGSYNVSIGGGGTGYFRAGGVDQGCTPGTQSSFTGSAIALFASGGASTAGGSLSGAPTIFSPGADLALYGVAGGGAGAGANGVDAYLPGYPGPGGVGLQYSLDGVATYYGGGGGGGSSQFNSTTPQALGGLGGGGLGGNRTFFAGDATNNTGGAGGGCGQDIPTSAKGNGGSGIVIITYKTAFA